MTAANAAPCVVSVAEHAGWAYLTCVAAVDNVPVVVDRRRVSSIQPGLPTQPYHHDSLGMLEDDANALIDRVRTSIDACTSAAVGDVVTGLAPAYTVIALAIRKPPFPELPATVATVRQSYQLQCAADGMLYQRAMCRAAGERGLALHQYRRGEETAWAAGQLGTTRDDIESFVSHRGRPAGPPWTQEHRRAYAAGIAVLATHVQHPLRIPKR